VSSTSKCIPSELLPSFFNIMEALLKSDTKEIGLAGFVKSVLGSCQQM